MPGGTVSIVDCDWTRKAGSAVSVRVLLVMFGVATAFGASACSSGSSGRSPGGSGGSGNVGGSGNIGGAGNVGTGTAFPNGIGTDRKWKTGTVAHTTGPYAPCGIIGTGRITFGASNPTGSEFAAASRAGVVLFYSPATGKQVRAPYYADGPVHGVDYSRDGTKLVVAGDTGVQIVRLADRKVLFSGKPFAISTHAAALSPDGAVIAALGWDGALGANGFTLQLVRVTDGTSMGMTSAEAPEGVAPQFSPDGKLLVVGGMILSVPGLTVLPPSPLSFSQVSPTYAALSPDGTMVAEGEHVLDIASGRELKAPMQGQNTLYRDWSAFSRDGTLYAEVDNAIHLWRTSDWTAIGTPTPIAFPQLTFSDGPDGRFFLSGDGAQLIATVQGVTGGDDGAVFQVMNVPDLTSGPTVAEPGISWSPAVLSPDGSLIMGVVGGSTRVWQTADLSPLSRLPETTPPYGFFGNGMLQIGDKVFDPRAGTRLGDSYWSAISPDGMLALALWPVSKASVIGLADLHTQVVLDTSAIEYPSAFVWTFSRDNRFVVGAGKDSNRDPKVVVFDAVTGTVTATLSGVPPVAIATTPTGAVRVAAFVPASTGFVSDVRVWSVPDGKPLFDIKQATAKNFVPSSNLSPLAFSPDGTLIATGATGIRIFQVETGALRETLPAHFDAEALLADPFSGVVSLAFSATGQIVSVGFDGTMRFWCSP